MKLNFKIRLRKRKKSIKEFEKFAKILRNFRDLIFKELKIPEITEWLNRLIKKFKI